MNEKEIYDRLTPVFREVFKEDDLVLGPSLSADTVEKWDSVNHLKLVLAVEEVFGFRFEFDEIAAFTSVGALVKLITAKPAAAQQP